MAVKITHFSLEWSFDHSQYWQGAGTYGTGFDHCYTGVGATNRDGFDDVCDQIAMAGFDTSTLEFPDESALDLDEDECEDGDECEHHYFVTIRFNAEDEFVTIARDIITHYPWRYHSESKLYCIYCDSIRAFGGEPNHKPTCVFGRAQEAIERLDTND